MAKSILEEIGGTYHEKNVYLILDLNLLTEEKKAYWDMGVTAFAVYQGT